MKLSSIHEPIVEWPNKKPNPGYGLSDLDRSHFKYYVGKINSELNKPINIPANYISLYNNVDPSAKMGEATMQNYLNNYILRKFANANKFKITTVGTLSMPTDPKDYEFNIQKDIILQLVPGPKVQEVYNAANKQLRLYYFGIIRNDPAKAQAEETKQVQEGINLFFFTINEDRNMHSTKARAFYYNVLLNKKFIELLMTNFCEVYKDAEELGNKYSPIFSRVTFKETPKLLIKLLKAYPEDSIMILQAAPVQLSSTIKSTIEADINTMPETDTKRIYIEKIMSVIGNEEFQKILDWYNSSEPSSMTTARSTD